jgi:hypothetical protein
VRGARLLISNAHHGDAISPSPDYIITNHLNSTGVGSPWLVSGHRLKAEDHIEQFLDDAILLFFPGLRHRQGASHEAFAHQLVRAQTRWVSRVWAEYGIAAKTDRDSFSPDTANTLNPLLQEIETHEAEAHAESGAAVSV